MMEEKFEFITCENIEEIMPIVIQGPTTYCREVCDYYKNYTQIWSTWNSEPEENLEFLKNQNNVHLVLDDLPSFSNDELSSLSEHASWTLQRATYQFTSTLNGFKYAKSIGSDFSPKIRSDFLIDLSSSMRLWDIDAFNSIGWHRGSVGYLVDYFFAAKVDDIITLMEGCLKLRHPSHSENVLTFFLLEKMRKRNIKYCLNNTVYTYSLKHKYDTNLFLGEVEKGKWLLDENQKHTSSNVNHTFTKDNLPDKYILTYGWGPI